MEGGGSQASEDCGSLRPDARDALPAEAVATEDKRAVTETMIAAHQALVDADPENFCKFKDVIDYLKQDLHHGDSASAD